MDDTSEKKSLELYDDNIFQAPIVLKTFSWHVKGPKARIKLRSSHDQFLKNMIVFNLIWL